ncbi:MAG: PH domain-containing protein [Alphaproteobacteria bacterium]|nr:PH domain-containing protein [Alphaproteobacteria bacterium]
MDPRRVAESRNYDLPSSLRPDEHVLVKGVISNGIFWKSIAVLIIALLVGLLAPPLGYFLTFVAVLMIGYGFMLKAALMMVVTNQRIFFRSGILKVDTVQVRMERVESVEIQRTIPGQILNYGTIVLTGTGTRFAFIRYLANAAHIRNVIDESLYSRDQAAQDAIRNISNNSGN